MALSDELLSEVQEVWNSSWKTRAGTKVPETENVKLENEAVELQGAVLYADLSESTAIVNKFRSWFAANIYKSYLLLACRIIRSNGGVITAFDGDRVMAVYIGDGKDSAAARTGLQINWAVQNILNETIKNKRYDVSHSVKQVVGIDTSVLFVARTGIRGSNDLVWVGRAANYAAKLAAQKGSSTWITGDVFKNLDNSAKYGRETGQLMWSERQGVGLGITVFASTWWWSV